MARIPNLKDIVEYKHFTELTTQVYKALFADNEEERKEALNGLRGRTSALRSTHIDVTGRNIHLYFQHACPRRKEFVFVPVYVGEVPIEHRGSIPKNYQISLED